MRLGQLARKLDIEPKAIVKFLEKQDITIENHLNTKLDDNQLALVSAEFTPEPEVIEEEVIAEPIPEIVEEIALETTEEIEKTTEEAVIIDQEQEKIVEEIIISEDEAPELDNDEEEITVEIYEIPEEEFVATSAIKEENKIDILTVSELLEKEGIQEGAEPIERTLHELSREDKVPEDIAAPTIKAPKIELKGIKVVGKIDLPEKEVKEIPKKEVATATDQVTNSTDKSSEPDTSENKEPKTHPNKIAKLKNAKVQYIAAKDLPQEEEVVKPKKAKEIKLEKKANASTKKKKKKHQPKEVILSPEAQAKLKIREKRKRQRQNTKEAATKKEKHWLKRIWDAIK